MILRILVIMENFFQMIYGFLDDVVDDFTDKVALILLNLLYIPFVFPFFLLSKLFLHLQKFTKMNKIFEKNKKAFMEWYRSQPKE